MTAVMLRDSHEQRENHAARASTSARDPKPVIDKTREIRLRNKARRCGYTLTKSGRRDPDAKDFGLYALLDDQTGDPVNPSIGRFIHSWTLDEVEHHLERASRPRGKGKLEQRAAR